MLSLNGRPFAVGRATFTDAVSLEERTARIYVQIRLGSLPPTLALLDTGAPWSIIDQEYSEALGAFSLEGQETTISTRVGEVSGRLVRLPLAILADRGEGEDYVSEPTVFVSRQWTLGTFLGYSGLLEFMRFALDPQQNHFYFGPAQD